VLDGLRIGGRERTPVGLAVGHDLAVDGRYLAVELLGLIACEIAGPHVLGDAAGQRDLA
jgi:uncharacterized protein YndB with AHSA1/START domain